MLENKLRDAIQNNDWETAQKIEALLVSQQNRILREMKERVEVQKIIMETKKIKKDYELGWTGVFATISGVIIAFVTLIKSFFSK